MIEMLKKLVGLLQKKKKKNFRNVEMHAIWHFIHFKNLKVKIAFQHCSNSWINKQSFTECNKQANEEVHTFYFKIIELLHIEEELFTIWGWTPQQETGKSCIRKK